MVLGHGSPWVGCRVSSAARQVACPVAMSSGSRSSLGRASRAEQWGNLGLPGLPRRLSSSCVR